MSWGHNKWQTNFDVNRLAQENIKEDAMFSFLDNFIDVFVRKTNFFTCLLD